MNKQPVIIVTDQVISRVKRDGSGSNHFQAMAYDNGKAFPQPFDQWIESADKAHKPGRYLVEYDDIRFRNGDFQVDRFACLARGPVSEVKAGLKSA